jgi:hypothetical protein
VQPVVFCVGFLFTVHLGIRKSYSYRDISYLYSIYTVYHNVLLLAHIFAQFILLVHAFAKIKRIYTHFRTIYSYFYISSHKLVILVHLFAHIILALKYSHTSLVRVDICPRKLPACVHIFVQVTLYCTNLSLNYS